MLPYSQPKYAARSLKRLQFEKLSLRRIPRIPPDGERIGISPLRVCSAQEVNSHVSININWYRL